MRWLLTLVLLCAAASGWLRGADWYVTDSGAGLKNGTSAGNAWSAAGYSAGTNQSPGDVIHFVGTIAHGVTVSASGSAGNPITLTCDAGAKFSAPSWTSATCPTYLGNPVVVNVPYSLGIHDVTLTNLHLEATDNGEPTLGFGHADQCYGIEFGPTFNGKVIFCTFTNLFQRVGGTNCVGVSCDAINLAITSTTNAQIAFNSIWMVGNAIRGSYDYNSAGVEIASNVINRINWGIYLAPSTRAWTTNMSIHDNQIDGFSYWDPKTLLGVDGPCSGIFHGDGIKVDANSQWDGTNVNLQVYNNIIGPDLFLISAAISFTPGNPYAFPGLAVYNNIVLCNTNPYAVPGGYVVVGNPAIQPCSADALVVNNTIIDYSQSIKAFFVGVDANAYPGPTSNRSRIYNNLAVGTTTAVEFDKWIPTVQHNGSDVAMDLSQFKVAFNAWSLTDPNDAVGDVYYYRYASPADQMGWAYATNYFTPLGVLLGNESGNFTNTVALNGYAASASLSGSNLTALAIARNLPALTKDIYGQPRPAIGAWQPGAIQGTNSYTPPGTPPAPLILFYTH